jgi:L-arabinokinase
LRTVVFYISGHGFGHASRSIEVINAILARRQDVRILARTTAAAWLFERTVVARPEGRSFGGRALHEGPGSSPVSRFTRHEVETDTGAVQIDSLHLDEPETIARAREFMFTFDARADAEARFLRDHRADVVAFDIPPLGVAAATRAGVPAVAIGNFTWDWIYSAYASADDVVRRIGEAYAGTTLALRLPMHGGFTSFPVVVDVPFVARRSTHSRQETRRLLGLPSHSRLVLLSFGVYGIERIDQGALAALDGYTVVGSASQPLDETALYDAGLRYEDLVRAVDVVVTKPGYGIISECAANETALLYTSRGHFREYDVLVREMPRYVRAGFITHEDLFSGRWQAALDALLQQPPPPERADASGAGVVAGRLLDMI